MKSYSNIATQTVVRAPADGYTVLGVDAAAAINATLYDKLNFNFIRDIAVVGIIKTPLVMLVHPSVPANTVLEFIAYAKANAGKINYASSGSGTPLHLAGELFKAMAEIDMTHVPYRGGAPAIIDLLGGQVQVLFTGVPPVGVGELCHHPADGVKYVVVIDDDVTDVDTDPEFDPFVLRYIDILISHGALDRGGAPGCIHCTGKLDQHAVACRPLRCGLDAQRWRDRQALF